MFLNCTRAEDGEEGDREEKGRPSGLWLQEKHGEGLGRSDQGWALSLPHPSYGTLTITLPVPGKWYARYLLLIFSIYSFSI